MSLNLGLAASIVLAALGVSITLMLTVRRWAPRGGFISDAERAAGVFGFVGTSYSVLLAFVIFLAFETYTNARGESAHEADAVFEQFEIAELFAAEDRDRIQSQLVCYARSVVDDEWDKMRAGGRSERVDSWVIQIEHSIDAISLNDARQVTGFDKFFDETIAREDGRRGRLQEAEGVVPAPMWVMLVVGAVCLLSFVLLFADSAERLLVQAVLIGAVTVFVVTPLLLVDFLDHPYLDKSGSIMPTSMQFALESMERERHGTSAEPCSDDGAPDLPQTRDWHAPLEAGSNALLGRFEGATVGLLVHA